MHTVIQCVGGRDTPAMLPGTQLSTPDAAEAMIYPQSPRCCCTAQSGHVGRAAMPSAACGVLWYAVLCVQ